jgi:hypothetical protein
MRYFAIALCALLAVCSASAAWAQYGLYGAPNVLPVEQQNAQAAYPTTPYPAQPAAQTTYQPYQPAAQYRYPAPNNPAPANQPAAWVAPAEQPMAAPALAAPNAPAPQQYQGQPAAVPGPVFQQPQPANGPAVPTFQQPRPINPPAPTGYRTLSPAPMTQGNVPQSSGMMNQMLADQAACNQGGCNTGCGTDAFCGPACECPWYASVSALVLNRGDARRIWVSANAADLREQLMTTNVPLAWRWGGEVQVGRRFCYECTPWALEGTFWTTNNFTGEETSTRGVANGVFCPLDINNITFYFPGGTSATARDYFLGTDSITVARRNEFYNLEINLLREQLPWTCDSPWLIGWGLGVRYFRFQESLTLSTSKAGTGNAFFRDTVNNNLIGPQINFDLAYQACNSVRLFVSPSFGVFGNIVDSRFEAQAAPAASSAYVNGANDIAGYPNFPTQGNVAGLAFLTQVDLGVDWQFTQNWSARVGYRVMAVTGTALADDQFPQYMCDTPDMENPQHTSSLLLHGAFLGVTYNF